MQINLINKLKYHHTSNKAGFTIVELLIVIVIIGILAAITIVSYSGITSRAQTAKIRSDLATLSKAIQLARTATSQTLLQITGYGWTGGYCHTKPVNTDLSTLPRTDACWTEYLRALTYISAASGVMVNNLVDPWGRPYYIDENEGESGGCSADTLAIYSQPFDGHTQNGVYVPLSGFTGCSG